MIARIFLLTQSPYTRHMASSVNADVMRSAGFEFIVLDTTDLLLPDLRGIHGELAAGEDVRRIANWDDLREISAQLTTNDVVVFWGAYYNRQLSEATPVYDIVSSSNALIGAVNSGHRPSHLAHSKDVGYFVTRLGRQLVDLISHPSEHGPKLVRRLTGSTSLAFPSRSVSPSNAHLRRPLDYLWTGTMIAPVSQAIISATTHVRYIHTFEYEKMQHVQIRPLEECSQIVYLEGMGPRHPDYVVQGTNPYSISSDKYDALIRRALTSIAKSSGCEVIIAAHPRAPRGSLEGRYGDYPVVYEETARLIASARVVVDAEGSTSVGMAAVANRPILFLHSKGFGKVGYRFKKDFARWLGAPILDIDSPLDKWSIPIVDEEAYANYVRQFLRRQGSRSEPFWEQVLGDLGLDFAQQDRTKS